LKEADLMEHCRKTKVALTSPNTLAATLYAVAMAFRGYEMQENARVLVRAIQDMNKHFDGFRQDFVKVGQRLTQATDDYQKASRDLERFDKTINKLKDGETLLVSDQVGK
jgi:DNA anti-recombination protein RmuC